jgi:hypothetical protein
LRRHLGVRHGLNGDEYRRRWGLRSDHPLTAPAYSERRSTLARELGLGRKAVTAVTPAAAEPAAANIEEQVETSHKSRRTRRSRSKSDLNESAAEPKARQRRPRSRAAPAQSEPPSTSTADA